MRAHMDAAPLDVGAFWVALTRTGAVSDRA